MTILDILAIMVPPTLGYVYGEYAKVQRTKVQETRAAERVRDSYLAQQERNNDEEKKQALANALLELDQHKHRIAALESEVLAHQTTINKLAEREF